MSKLACEFRRYPRQIAWLSWSQLGVLARRSRRSLTSHLIIDLIYGITWLLFHRWTINETIEHLHILAKLRLSRLEDDKKWRIITGLCQCVGLSSYHACCHPLSRTYNEINCSVIPAVPRGPSLLHLARMQVLWTYRNPNRHLKILGADLITYCYAMH